MRGGHSGGEAGLASRLMRRIKITVAYDGGPFHGWQVQPALPTIQGLLETILTGMEGAPVHVAGSGRTDAGVHALEQVAAFSLENPIPMENLRRAVNRLLPPTVRVYEPSAPTRYCLFMRFDTMPPRMTAGLVFATP